VGDLASGAVPVRASECYQNADRLQPIPAEIDIEAARGLWTIGTRATYSGFCVNHEYELACARDNAEPDKSNPFIDASHEAPARIDWIKNKGA